MISLTGTGFGVATQSWQSVCAWLVIISSTDAWPAVLYSLFTQWHASAIQSSAGSGLDPDTGEEVDSEIRKAEVFESAGLRASCSECGHAILCGVLHSGSCNQEPLGGDGILDIDPRAERPLRFRCHELVSETPIAADHAMVTFLLCCRAGGGTTALISRDWEKHMLPYASSLGMDDGITGDD